MKTAYFGKDGKIHCPYCNSVQVKAARNQPKKYPAPKKSWFWVADKNKVNSLTDFWNNGYDCKKCGEEFILRTSPAAISQPIQSQPLPKPKKKKGGFLWKLAFWVLLIFFGLMAWGWYENQNKPSKHKSAKSAKVQSDSIEKSQDMNDTLSITETKKSK